MRRRFSTLRIPLPLALGVIFIVAVFATVMMFQDVGGAIKVSSVPGPASITDILPKEEDLTPEALQVSNVLSKKEELVRNGELFIYADLSQMKLQVFDNGVVAKEVPILTKGREGSWFETPVGVYEVELKKTNHFSSFGHVYQPWSMIFQGNFFIHGWPYYPGGEPVASTYSGGCIRLSTEDAKAVYDMIKTGTPVLVTDDYSKSDGFAYERRGKAKPNVHSRSYLVADLKNNFVFSETNSKEELPIASVAKLMTAIVAVEHAKLDNEIAVPQSALVYTTRPRFKAGDRLEAWEFLYPLLAESSNEAALSLSHFFGKERFVSLMNKKAEALGMTHTRFVDAAGIEEGNVSNAEDLIILAKYLYSSRSFVLNITAGNFGGNSYYGKPNFKDLQNFNIFGQDPDFVGGKVGQTVAAKETMLAVFEKEFQGEKRPIAVVVLGSDRVGDEVSELIGHITENYR